MKKIKFGNSRINIEIDSQSLALTALEDKKSGFNYVVAGKPLFSFNVRLENQVKPRRVKVIGKTHPERSKKSKGLLSGADQLTLTASTTIEGIKTRLNFLCYPDESLIYYEPEIYNGSERVIVVSSPAMHFSLNWNPALEEYRLFSHFVFTRLDSGLAIWYPIGHVANNGGRAEYVRMPVRRKIENGKANFRFPCVTPRRGTYTFKDNLPFRIVPGASARLFGLIFAVGKIEEDDPFSVLRQARKTIFYRGHKKPLPLPPVGWSSWNWPLDNWDPNMSKKLGYKIYPVGSEGCKEWYVFSQLEKIKTMPVDLIWLDIQPVIGGPYVIDKTRFSKRFFKRLKDERLSLNFIMVPCQTINGYITLEGKLKEKFGKYQTVRQKSLCIASPWGKYVAKKFAHIARQYDLGYMQIAFTDYNFIILENQCNASDHGHLPYKDCWTDYARKYIESYNNILDSIHSANPRTICIQNVPWGACDYAIDYFDSRWAGDQYHAVELYSKDFEPSYYRKRTGQYGLLDRMQIERRLWPIDIYFCNHMSPHFETNPYSFYLLVNIAYVNNLVFGANFHLLSPELIDFYRRWLTFYRANRQALNRSYRYISQDAVAHADINLGYILIFDFNRSRKKLVRDLTIPVREMGVKAKDFLLFIDDVDSWKLIGTLNSQDGKIIIKSEVQPN